MRKISTDNEICKCNLIDTFDFGPWKATPENGSSNKFVKISTSQLNVLHFIDHKNNKSIEEKQSNL